MKPIVGKKTGRPDFTTDTFVATSPLVIRHQTRNLGAFIYRDITFGPLGESGASETLIMNGVPLTQRGITDYYMWFAVTLSTYRYFRVQISEIDLDRAIEYWYDLYPWSRDDVIVADWGKAIGWGTVVINRGVSSPAQIVYPPDAPASTYSPDVMKYCAGIWILIYGQPGETITTDIAVWFNGMSSKFEE
jgi:hypothetical protein